MQLALHPFLFEKILKINEKSPLLLGKLMVLSKGWRDARRNYYARCSVVGESCMQYTTHPLLGSRVEF